MVKNQDLIYIKYILLLSSLDNNNIENIKNYLNQINLEKSDLSFYEKIRKIFLAIFEYNNKLTIEEKIELLEINYKKLHLGKKLNNNFQNLKNILLLLYKITKDIDNINNYHQYYNYILTNVKNDKILKYSSLYFLLKILNSKNLIFKDKEFSLELIEVLEQVQIKNIEKYNLYQFLFGLIIYYNKSEDKN